MTECSICCEKFNRSNHLKVECKGCDGLDSGSACRQCCKTYILTNTKEASCMFCKSGWDRDFMNTYLSKTFVNKEYKEYTENLYVEKQIALLPATQNDAIKEKKIRELEKSCKEAESELNRLTMQVLEQKNIIKNFTWQITNIRISGTVEEKNNFVTKCPHANCNGFLNNRHYCNMCENKFCKDCMEIKTEDHVCDEELKATIKAIKKESKPCPGCGEAISKIDGCDQMWCVKCHIQFSWRSGQQLQGYNHNPEYFRWMRETGRNIARNPNEENCEELTDLKIHYVMLKIGSRSQMKFVQDVYRMYRHIGAFYIRIQESQQSQLQLRKLRVQYLLNEITKEAWKTKIQKIEKDASKKKSYNDTWRLAYHVIESHLINIVRMENSANFKENLEAVIKQLIEFKLYINASFINISNNYGSTTCPGIEESWRESFNYKKYIKRTRS